MNSTFRARWLASLEVISQPLFTSEQQNKNKIASHFASVSKERFFQWTRKPYQKTKMATKLGVTEFNESYLISPTSYSMAKNQNTMSCLRKLASTKILIFYSLVSTTRGIWNLTQPLGKWHCSNLTNGCKSFICLQEGIAYCYSGSPWSTPEKSIAE